MFPLSRGAGSGRRLRVLAALAAAVAMGAAACSSAPAATFSPTGPCVADGRTAGAYPALEALVPKTLAGAAPKTLDSGRNCTAANLGTLASHGLHEVHFAGGLWPDSDVAGVTLTVWQAPGLTADWLGEWYEAGARQGRSTGSIAASRITVNGRPANRLDLQNGDAKQSVVTWAAPPGTSTPDGDVVYAVLASDVPEARIQQALAAFP